ncbi:putative dolichyl-P-Man:GDP-Man7GlcNAc2-PP-dolichyl alpha-1,6-mannosyltransferase [Trypanosoma rangeli]|uniref:Mannosyltransferase n=1 Tax=Trypanosoma rangeli TaxID=5698 RepID=A0A3R7M881_TRYRA|nr:putative dolichyl-P-Man:GDP-Man7GlcNAc2-PP-dolichyl alpha-1,6-mannosyltransferase [Trypanosoma rangeli]RNF01230.1 putative dolichyl-P-Man:GDP-Man7GlcNAc2-PP-dolichyl alpha-1,6-mannosyltransferase [Trypanosoma rangeli]|eukprot:RNF01230.1 putative dolichyl-P-Man:GDP-Man7GlcNAc2-PP-dolichyl alpha-1,6-mannosyltransferase [Trypanosoma rangeli]
MEFQSWLCFLVLCISVTVCELLCPYTKVEESFGMQAMHDFIFCSTTACGDHLMFPGVVPRTFYGSYIVAVTALFCVLVMKSIGTVAKYLGVLLGLMRGMMGARSVVLLPFVEVSALQSPMFFSHACRLVMGFMVCGALWYIASGIDVNERKFVKLTKNSGWRRFRAASAFFVLCNLQFHMVFYATRTLPNTNGLILCSLAFGCIVRGRYRLSIVLLSVCTAVFRCDTVLLLGSLGLFLLLRREMGIFQLVAVSLFSMVIAVCCSVVLDSFLWGDWVWPEGVVLFFNTVKNQSWRWGRSPWHWYFTYALPRAFLFAFFPLLLLVGLACWDLGRWLMHRTPPSPSPVGTLFSIWLDTSVRFQSLLLPATLFVVLYSFLPHKELRFIMEVFPAFLAPMAYAIALTWNACVGAQEAASTKLTGRKGVPAAQRPAVPTTNSQHCTRVDGRCGRMKYSLAVVLGCVFLLQLAAFVLSVGVSMQHYPGGQALAKLHHVIDSDIRDSSSCINRVHKSRANSTVSLTVFIDAYAAMSGINRFQKAHRVLPPGRASDKVGCLSLTSYSVGDRLFSLLCLPFVAILKVTERRATSLNRWSEYDYLNLYRNNGEAAVFGDNVSIIPFAFTNTQLRGVGLCYTKDPTLFDEEHGVYNGDGLDYLLVRYSQREMHRQRGEFEEIFTVFHPDFWSLLYYWASRLWPWNEHHRLFSEQLDEPFLIALRRRCK